MRDNQPPPDEPPAELPLAQLEQRCHEETAKWRAGQPNDERFCLEIFRRAVALHRDEDAWQPLVVIYAFLIEANIPWTPMLRLRATRDDIAQDTWERFSKRARRGDLKCNFLGEILSFLKKTTRTAVIEWERKNRYQPEPLPPGYDPPDPKNQFSSIDKEIFLKRARVVLKDPLMYAIFWLSYRYDLAPRQIVPVLEKLGLSWNRPLTVKIVTELLRQCIDRLAADPIIRGLLEAD